jgi:hypothetical protein
MITVGLKQGFLPNQYQISSMNESENMLKLLQKLKNSKGKNESVKFDNVNNVSVTIEGDSEDNMFIFKTDSPEKKQHIYPIEVKSHSGLANDDNKKSSKSAKMSMSRKKSAKMSLSKNKSRHMSLSKKKSRKTKTKKRY